MIDLQRFLQNPFDDPAISLAELLSFSTDHLARMIANNAGAELAARITATTSALDLVGDCATDDQTKLGLRKARKQVKDAFRKELPAKVAKIGAAVGAAFSPDAPEMTECFPQGRTVFGACTDDEVENHLQTLINGLTEYAAQVGAPVVASATALLTSWTAIYAASESATGAKTTSQEGKKLARENLQLMLFLNLLKLAEMFARQPEKLALYMRQDLLEDSAPAEPPEPPTPPTPPGP